MEEKFNAICIRSVSYKDNDKMLSLFSLENGIVDCVLRGVKKSGAKLKFAGELFCFAEYVVAVKNGRRTVIEATQIDDFYEIRLDIEKYYCATAIIEYLRAFCREDEKPYDLFLDTVNALKAIENGKNAPQLVLVKFFEEGLKKEGYGISFSSCASCKKPIDGRVFFDFDTCQFKCYDCADYLCAEMRASTYALLSNLTKIDLSELKNGLKPTYSEAFSDNEVVKNALKFYDFFISDKIGVRIKSNEAILNL